GHRLVRSRGRDRAEVALQQFTKIVQVNEQLAVIRLCLPVREHERRLEERMEVWVAEARLERVAQPLHGGGHTGGGVYVQGREVGRTATIDGLIDVLAYVVAD